MDADELLKKVGAFGPYQMKLLLVLFLFSVVNAWGPLAVIFTHYKPEFNCTKFEMHGGKGELPSAVNQTWEGTESCEVSYFENTTYGNVSISNVTERVLCTQWEFATSNDGGETVVTEMQLICDRAFLEPLVVSLMMVGKGAGMLICGGLSDKFGRRFVYMLTASGSTVAIFGMSFAQSVYTYAAFTAIMGAFSTPQYAVLFLVGSEMVLPKKRRALGLLVAVGYSVGYAVLPAFAYPVSNWRWFLRIIGFGNLSTMSGYWLIPETLHWLIAKRHVKEAKGLLMKISVSNGKHFVPEESTCTPLAGVAETMSEECDLPSAKVQGSVFRLFGRLFAHPILRMRLLATAFIWFATSVVYYAVALDMSAFRGDRYLNCFLSGILEIPSIAIVYAFLDKGGRIKLLTVLYAISGLACALVPLLQIYSDIALTILAMIGKTAISGGSAAVYIHTSEECPTPSRTSFLGFCSVCARFGAVIAPYLMFIGETLTPDYVPFLTMGVLGIASSLLILFCLPETTGTPLPSSVSEAEKQQTLFKAYKKREVEETSQPKREIELRLKHGVNSGM